MNKAVELELKRLEKLDYLQLLVVLDRVEADPAPKWVKDLILNKIRSILNRDIGLTDR